MHTCYKIVALPQGSHEWLEYRKNKIGSSDAAAIMGVSRHKTRLQIWESKKFGDTTKVTGAMRRGNEMEPIARNLFNKGYGGGFEPAVLLSEQHPDLMASLDCFRIKDGKVEIAEIKAPKLEDHLLALSGQVPEDYNVQIHHQMLVSGAEFARYISFDGQKGVVLHVRRNDKLIDKLLEEEKVFLASLLDFKPPEATDRDVTEIVDSRLVYKGNRLNEVNRQINELTKEKEQLRKELVDEVGITGGYAHCRIGSIRLDRYQPPGRIDMEEVEKVLGSELDKYRKPSKESWRVTEVK